MADEKFTKLVQVLSEMENAYNKFFSREGNPFTEMLKEPQAVLDKLRCEKEPLPHSPSSIDLLFDNFLSDPIAAQNKDTLRAFLLSDHEIFSLLIDTLNDIKSV